MPEATVSLERLDLAHDEAPRGDPLDAARGLGVARQRVSQNAPVQQRAVHKRKTHHIVRVPQCSTPASRDVLCAPLRCHLACRCFASCTASCRSTVTSAIRCESLPCSKIRCMTKFP